MPKPLQSIARTNVDALKTWLNGLPEWSFVTRHEIERHARQTIPSTTGQAWEDDAFSIYVQNALALAKRRGWLRTRRGYPGRYQVLPIA